MNLTTLRDTRVRAMTLGEHPWTEEIVRLFDDLEDEIIAVFRCCRPQAPGKKQRKNVISSRVSWTSSTRARRTSRRAC